MYDDEYDWLSDPADTEVHLCRECRELMNDVIRAENRRSIPPTPPDWQQALDWLAAQCGGLQAVEALDDAPLSAVGLDLPRGLEPGERQRLESAATLLDGIARRFFDEEAGIAFRRALLRVFERAPGVVTGARTTASLALGVVCAVGHANGLLYPRGRTTEKALKAYLDVTGSGSTVGDKVQSALRGPYTWDNPAWPYRWGSSRDLRPLGHLDLLVSGTRRQLLGVRDRAVSTRDAEVPRAS